MSTLILGSKPNPTIPDIDWDWVVYINGSIGRPTLDTASPQTVHVVSDYALTDGQDPESVRAAIRGRHCNHLILIKASPDNPDLGILHTLDYTYNNLTVLDKTDRYKITTTVIGKTWRWKALLHQPTSAGKAFLLRRLLTTRLDNGQDGPKPSSGVFALLYCLYKQVGSPPYVLAGVGLQSGVHSHNSLQQYAGLHNGPDRAILLALSRHTKYGLIVRTAEDELIRKANLRMVGGSGESPV